MSAGFVEPQRVFRFQCSGNRGRISRSERAVSYDDEIAIRGNGIRECQYLILIRLTLIPRCRPGKLDHAYRKIFMRPTVRAHLVPRRPSQNPVDRRIRRLAENVQAGNIERSSVRTCGWNRCIRMCRLAGPGSLQSFDIRVWIMGALSPANPSGSRGYSQKRVLILRDRLSNRKSVDFCDVQCIRFDHVRDCECKMPRQACSAFPNDSMHGSDTVTASIRTRISAPIEFGAWRWRWP